MAKESVAAAGFGSIATLVLPADVSWGDNPGGAEGAAELPVPTPVADDHIAAVADKLRNAENGVLMIGGREITREQGLLPKDA